MELSSLPEDLQKPAKRRKKSTYYRPKHNFPVIFKTDVRRRLPMMYMNLMNLSDPSLFRDFLRHFASKRLKCSTYYPATTATVFPLVVQASTFDHIVSHYAYRTATCPDTVCRLHTCELRRSKHFEGTEVRAVGWGVGTKLYELRPCTSTSSAVTAAPPSSTSTSAAAAAAAVAEALGALPLDLDVLSTMLVPLAQPLRVTQWIECIFTLDAQHCIRRVQVRCLASSYLPVPGPAASPPPT